MVKFDPKLTIKKQTAKKDEFLIKEGNQENHAILVLKTNGKLPEIDVLKEKDQKSVIIQSIKEERILGLIGFLDETYVRTASIQAKNSFDYLVIPTSYFELLQPYFVKELIDIIKNDRNGLDMSKSFRLKTDKDQVIENVKLVYEFQKSMEESEFEVHYQPIVDLETNALKYMEALSRWLKAPKGIYPDKYFGQIEITPLSTLYFFQMLDTVLSDISEYNIPGVSVNVAAYDLRTKGFAEKIIETANQKGIEPIKLKIELTERASLSSPQVKENVNTLKQAGFKICLDDFGEGESSVKLVPELRPDVIKIDKSWLSYEDIDLESLISYGKTNKCEVIVEGIETLELAQKIKEMGADLGQGYLYCKPMAISDLIEKMQFESAS